MPKLTQNELNRKEERLKELVYCTFDKMTSSAASAVHSLEDRISKGNIDDKEVYFDHGELSKSKRERKEVEELIGSLYNNPYFAHIEVKSKDIDKNENFFLSDSESLDQYINIGENEILLPFKKDSNRPIIDALFHCYQQKKGNPISYKGPMGDLYTFTPLLICNTDIWQRKLKETVALYPPVEEVLSADEFLELKLEENRNNPTLRNIISSLQQKQFDIIGINTDKSFVVQGCAGSGKSQCLLHRLFYLRDVLSEEGWEKVLLITPTMLFRQYSSDLIRRYH